MTTTPIWVTLLTASVGGLVGGLLALFGDKIRQRHADRREGLRWAREDAARSYEHRRAAYVDFIKEFYRLSMASDEVGEAWKEEPADHDFFSDYVEPIIDSVVQIQIFGTKEAAKLAGVAGHALIDRVFFSGKKIAEDDVLAPLLSEIRRHLSIPDR